MPHLPSKQRFGSRRATGRRTADPREIPLVIPFAQTRIKHPISVPFDAPSPEPAAVAGAEESFAHPVAAFPAHVRVANLSMILLACGMLLVGSLFMPGKQLASNWWHGLARNSAGGFVPALLGHWELLAGAIGLVLVPFLRAANRGRLALNLSLSVGFLLLIAVLEQHAIGAPLVIMPTLGLAMMAILNAILRARTLEPRVNCLRTWQIFAGMGSVVLWSLPTYEVFQDSAIQSILQTAGGNYLWWSFGVASTAGFCAGVLSVIDSGENFSPQRNRIARVFSSTAIVMMSLSGLVLCAQVAQISSVFQESARWFGVGLMWLDLVLTSCVLMAWSGLIERFGLVAVTRQGIPDHAAAY